MNSVVEGGFLGAGTETKVNTLLFGKNPKYRPSLGPGCALSLLSLFSLPGTVYTLCVGLLARTLSVLLDGDVILSSCMSASSLLAGGEEGSISFNVSELMLIDDC